MNIRKLAPSLISLLLLSSGSAAPAQKLRSSAPDISVKHSSLGFRVEQLKAAFQNDSILPSSQVKDNSFRMELTSAISILGCSQKDGTVTDVSVICRQMPDKSQFYTCIEKIINLANSHHKEIANTIATRFIHRNTKQNSEEYLERDGTRYHLQKLFGSSTFHCCSVDSDDQAIRKAQPG